MCARVIVKILFVFAAAGSMGKICRCAAHFFAKLLPRGGNAPLVPRIARCILGCAETIAISALNSAFLAAFGSRARSGLDVGHVRVVDGVAWRSDALNEPRSLDGNTPIEIHPCSIDAPYSYIQTCLCELVTTPASQIGA